MSAQMLAAAANASGTVADLAPGAKDGMRMLEAKAAEMSVAAGEIIAAEKRGGRMEISFVRGETTGGDKNAPKVTNPDEIDIDEDDDDDNDDDEETAEGMDRNLRKLIFYHFFNRVLCLVYRYCYRREGSAVGGFRKFGESRKNCKRRLIMLFKVVFCKLCV